METRQWLITLFDFGSVKARKAGGCEKGTLCKIYIVNGKNMKGSGYLWKPKFEFYRNFLPQDLQKWVQMSCA